MDVRLVEELVCMVDGQGLGDVECLGDWDERWAGC